ncbi:hypothetical protein BDB01DRAFT_769617 [Pilobolus umbonatus]|nr:hypothetical protein BDB01DRAFT_769617 [Pilobolus umbonatus]
MRLNLFNAKKECFPKDMSPGDIIVLKNLKVELYNHSYFGVSQPSTVYTVYKQDTLVQLPIPDIECDMTEAEEDIVEALDLWYAEKKASMKNTAIVASGVRPYLRTDQLLSHPTKFFDYIGMVVSYKKDNLNPVVNLTLTDFTKNMAPIKLKQVQYPIDREFLLHCTLWDNNAVNCPPLVYGDYVRICNGVKRLSKEGSAEFRVNGDRDNGRKLTKLSADDHLLKDLLKRKKEYSSR